MQKLTSHAHLVFAGLRERSADRPGLAWLCADPARLETLAIDLKTALKKLDPEIEAHPTTYAEMSKTALDQGRAALVILLVEARIALRGAVSPFDLRQDVLALIAADAEPELVREASIAFLLTDPCNLMVAARFTESLMRIMPTAQVADEVAAVIAAHPEQPQVGLALQLIGLLDETEARERLIAIGFDRASAAVEQELHAARLAFADPHSSSPEEALALARRRRPEVLLAALLSPVQTRFITIMEVDKILPGLHSRNFLDSPSFRLDPQTRAEIETSESQFTTPERFGWAHRKETKLAYQSYALRHGRIDINDIYGSGAARYLGSVQFHDKFLYLFAGARLQILVCGTTTAEILGLYLPHEDVFVRIDRDKSSQFSPSGWNQIKTLCLHRFGAPATGAPDAEARGLMLRIGGTENFAHHIWNYFGALERVVRSGGFGHAESIEYAGTEFYGPLTELYPELSRLPIHYRSGSYASTDHMNDSEHLPLPLTTVLLNPTVPRRIEAVAATRATQGEPEGQKSGPRIYLSVRAGDKSWVNADTEVPRLLERLFDAAPEATVLLDGFSLPAGRDHITSRWIGPQSEITAMLERIMAALPGEGRVRNISGLDLLEAHLLIRKCDFYICPIGTAHHKVDWTCDMPGIVYAAPSWREVPLDQRPGHGQRYQRHTPLYVFGESESMEGVRLRLIGDRRPNLANFNCSHEEIWTVMAEALGLVVPTGVEGAS